MSKLASVTNEPELKLKKVIAKLEDLSGYHSYDVRLLAGADVLLRTKIASLGLDPNDTTGQELYYSLVAKLEADLAHITRAWAVNDDNAALRLQEIAAQNLRSAQVLALKSTAIKSTLRALPAKKTMKLLKHRSLDSMLKRESLAEVLSLALKTESAAWKTKLAAKISKLTTSSFEIKPIALKSISSDSDFSVSYVPLTGIILLSGQLKASAVIKALFDVLTTEEIIEGQSFYLSAHQFSPEFSSLAADLVTGRQVPSVSIADQPFIDWHQAGQLIDQKDVAYERLCSLHPTLRWWKDLGHSALVGEGPVSLHIGDVLESSAKQLDYDKRQFKHLSREVKTKLIAAYFHHPAVSDYIRQQIDGTLMSLDAGNVTSRMPAYEFAEA